MFAPMHNFYSLNTHLYRDNFHRDTLAFYRRYIKGLVDVEIVPFEDPSNTANHYVRAYLSNYKDRGERRVGGGGECGVLHVCHEVNMKELFKVEILSFVDPSNTANHYVRALYQPDYIGIHKLARD